MSHVRRRLVRAIPTTERAGCQRQRQRLHARLDQEQTVLARWMVRLRRAFHAVEKSQRKIHRYQRQIACQEDA